MPNFDENLHVDKNGIVIFWFWALQLLVHSYGSKDSFYVIREIHVPADCLMDPLFRLRPV